MNLFLFFPLRMDLYAHIFPFPLFARSLNQSTISSDLWKETRQCSLACFSFRLSSTVSTVRCGGRNREGKTRHLLGKTREQGGHEWLCASVCIDIHQESQSQGRSLLCREREVLTNMETLLKNIEASNRARVRASSLSGFSVETHAQLPIVTRNLHLYLFPKYL